jgi:ABC-type branched-subunit amino acid transport system substrate-binding protein
MAYCVNPYCQAPDNSIASGSTQPPSDFSAERLCHSCQTPLLLNDRYTVLGAPLCDRHPTLSPNARVFEVQDSRDPQTPKVLKVLCSSQVKLVSLFTQEQEILTDREHPHDGIPKGYEAFDLTTPYGQVLPCLVMEKIMGQNLEQRRLALGPIDPETALNGLKQLAEILHHIHQQDFFHRDIKPSNIMRRSANGHLVLIDFGTARRVTETIVAGEASTVVVSYNYTAPEQLNGQAEKRSDFYALGKTILHLMTDLPKANGEDVPPANQREFAARSQVKLSPAFEKLLFDLIHPAPSLRPRDTAELLKRIREIEKEGDRRKRKNIGLIFAGGLLCGASIMTPLLKRFDWEQMQQSLFPIPVCDIQVGDLISCGEEMLLDGLDDGISPPEDKKIGIQAFSVGEYQKAQTFFQKAFDRERDPETLIYLNNARVNADPQFAKRKVTIAAVVPLGKKEARTRAIAMLRGVAQAQSNALERYNLGLQIVLIDDKNNALPAKEISQKLVKRKDILGGVGHASSDALIAALPQYEMNQFVFIAPASTSEELTSSALRENHIFFRSLPSNRVNANFMTALLISDLKRPKIAIYYNPTSPYSRSLASEIRSTYQIYRGEVLMENPGLFQIEQETFDPKVSLKYARDRDANVHILIPDGAVQTTSASNSLKLVKENAGKDWIIAGDSLAGVPEYIKGGDDGFAQYALGKMIFSASWDPSADLKSPLLSYWNSTKQSKSLVDWRTYTSYNAVWMLATALKDPTVRTREQLRNKLSQPNFQSIAIGSGDESRRQLSFQEKSGEIANPKIYLSIVAKCGDRYTTVLYKNPVCPDGKPAFSQNLQSNPKAKSDVAK